MKRRVAWKKNRKLGAVGEIYWRNMGWNTENPMPNSVIFSGKYFHWKNWTPEKPFEDNEFFPFSKGTSFERRNSGFSYTVVYFFVCVPRVVSHFKILQQRLPTFQQRLSGNFQQSHRAAKGERRPLGCFNIQLSKKDFFQTWKNFRTITGQKKVERGHWMSPSKGITFIVQFYGPKGSIWPFKNGRTFGTLILVS